MKSEIITVKSDISDMKSNMNQRFKGVTTEINTIKTEISDMKSNMNQRFKGV
ncbi:hypothetical protein KHA80_14925 [Anaerobacillus sp. HL2]|nr:hypothetical protein KHA80_14925 [Anaerobacillus sp. HL2]